MQNSSLRRRYCKKISMLSSAEEKMHFKSHQAERGEAASLVPLYLLVMGLVPVLPLCCVIPASRDAHGCFELALQTCNWLGAKTGAAASGGLKERALPLSTAVKHCLLLDSDQAKYDHISTSILIYATLFSRAQ